MCIRDRCASANGESQRALDLLQAAHDAATEAEAPLEEAKCLLHRVRFLPPAEAQSVIAEALALYEHHGTAWNLATCHDMLARTWRDRGDLPRAEMSARHAIQLLDDIETGGSAAIQPRLTLALVHLQRDQADEALDLAHGARRWGIRAQRPRTIALADAILVVVATLLERTHDWEVAFNELADTLRRVRQPDPDIAWCLERAGKLAVATQEFHHAGRALALALELYQDLGMGPRAEQVQDLLNSVRENTDSSS